MRWKGSSTFGSPIAVDIYPSNGLHGEQVLISLHGTDVLLSPEKARGFAKAIKRAARKRRGSDFHN